MHLEFADAIGSSKAFETLNRHLAASGHKSDELSPLNVVKFFEDLPEKLYRFRLRVKTLDDRVLTQVVNIDVLEA